MHLESSRRELVRVESVITWVAEWACAVSYPLTQRQISGPKLSSLSPSKRLQHDLIAAMLKRCAGLIELLSGSQEYSRDSVSPPFQCIRRENESCVE